jgi:hypothetical protein
MEPPETSGVYRTDLYCLRDLHEPALDETRMIE